MSRIEEFERGRVPGPYELLYRHGFGVGRRMRGMDMTQGEINAAYTDALMLDGINEHTPALNVARATWDEGYKDGRA